MTRTETITEHSDGTSRRWDWLRVQRITRGDGAPYLWRLILFRCPWFAVYLHVFLGDDDLCEHSHPWDFVSIILWGGYYEITQNGRLWRWYLPGSVLVRRAEWRHRVMRFEQRTAVSLVLTGRKRQSWGFYTRDGVFIPWKQYSTKVHCN